MTSATSELTLPLVRASEVVSRSERWLWQNRIPWGKLTILEGRAGKGKTFLAIDLVARLTRGDAFPDGASLAGGPADVLFLDFENGAAEIKRRLQAAGADLDRVHILDLGVLQEPGAPSNGAIAMSQLDKRENVLRLEQWIRTHCPHVRMIVLDPLIAATGCGDSNDQVKVRRALQPLVQVAEHKGIALLAIRHFRKGAGLDPGDAGAGSQAWRAVARCSLQVREVEGARYLACEKMNNGKQWRTLEFRIPDVDGDVSPRVEWGGASPLDAEQLARLEFAATDPRDRRHRASAADDRELFDALFPGNGGRTLKDIAPQGAASGKSEGSLRRLLNGWVESGWLAPPKYIQQLGYEYRRAPSTDAS